MRNKTFRLGITAFVLGVVTSACSSNKVNEPATPSDNTTGTANTTTSGTTAQPQPGVQWPACANSGVMQAAGSGVSPSCVTTSAIDVKVTVDAAQGPSGFAKPIAITNALYSMGIDDKTRGDYVPSLSPKFVSYLKALHPGMLRFPAGYNGQQYAWGTTDGPKTMTPALLDAFVALCRAVGAEPFLAVNIEHRPMSDALAMLNYVNKTKNYGVKWWQIGNEPNLVEAYPDESPEKYAATYLQFRSAMLQIDPNLKFVGIESYTGEDLNFNPHEPDWLTPFLKTIGPNEVDAFAFHYYPLTSAATYTYPNSSIVPSMAHLMQENATDWPPSALNYPDKIMPYMRKAMAEKVPNAQVWVDEFAEDSGSTLNGVGYSDVMLGALWAADSMGRFADQGIGAMFHFIFKAVSPTMTYGYTLLDQNNVPRPEYYTYWLMANHYGDNVISATSDARDRVAAHAAIRGSDCSVRVMLINKATTAQAVRLTLKGYTPVSAE
ncbi:MAG: hypothetical protein EOO38_13950, partial [Cytophagaceae bacterium]